MSIEITNSNSEELILDKEKANAIFDSLDNLKKIYEEKDAEDKMGAFTSGALVLILAAFITSSICFPITKIFKCPMKEYVVMKLQSWNKHYNELLNNNKPKDTKKAKDLFDVALDFLNVIIYSSPLVGAGVFYVKSRAKKNKQRHMEKMMDEEIANLENAFNKEEQSLSNPNGSKNKDVEFSGATLVELFNSFADIMGIKDNLPRNDEDTALEYFFKVSVHLNFPKDDAIKAAKFFERELYGKYKTTSEDKRAFIQLLKQMMKRMGKHRAKNQPKF